MALDERPELAMTTLQSAITSGSGSMTLVDATAFPIPSVGYECFIYDPAPASPVDDVNFRSSPINDPDVERVRVTGGSGNTRNIDRGQGNTSAAAHPAGAIVIAGVSSKMFDDIETQLDTIKHSFVLSDKHSVDYGPSETHQFYTHDREASSDRRLYLPFYFGDVATIRGSLTGGTHTAGTIKFSLIKGEIGEGSSTVIADMTIGGTAVEARQDFAVGAKPFDLSVVLGYITARVDFDGSYAGTGDETVISFTLRENP